MFLLLHLYCARFPKEEKMREMFLAYNSKQPDWIKTIGWEMREIAVPEKVTHLVSNYI